MILSDPDSHEDNRDARCAPLNPFKSDEEQSCTASPVCEPRVSFTFPAAAFWPGSESERSRFSPQPHPHRGPHPASRQASPPTPRPLTWPPPTAPPWRVPVLLGGILTVSGGGLPAGTRIAVTWASALYAVEAAPALTRGTDAFACSFDAPPSDDGTTAGATVVLEADLPEGDYTLALGSVRALTYPDDVIDSPAATSLTLSLPDGDEQVAQESVDTGTSTDSLWGATTGVIWSPARWGAGYHLWNPVAVAITATGPSPVPAGTMIDVQVDAGAFTGLAVGPDGAAVQGSAVGEVLRASYPLPDAVGAQDVLAIPVLATLADLNGELPAYEPPLLALTNAEASSTQRLTGLEAATREDNAFDTASRARYGM